MNKNRTIISRTIAQIEPYDSREMADRAQALAWIRSGAPLCRVKAPDVPSPHLVSYFVLYDPRCASVLLIDHIKSGLWLPPGGHVEDGETPRQTVEREIVEELGIEAAFTTQCADLPLFLTMTQTRGVGAHTDVSLWYVVAGDSRQELEYEREEMGGYRWLTLPEARAMRHDRVDPEFFRFITKLEGAV